MNKETAIEAAKQIGLANGETVVVQSDGQIEHPHYHPGQTSGDKHTDGWVVTNDNGYYRARKVHDDD